MRVQFKLALVFLIALAAWSGTPGQATAGSVHLGNSAVTASAHGSSMLHLAQYIAGERADRCYVRHLECRYTSGFGHRYRRCMRRGGCGYRPHYGYGDVHRSCRYWLRRCRENWYYPEDIRGCLRYHGCLHRSY